MNYIHATLEDLLNRGYNFGGKKSAPPPPAAPAAVAPTPEPVVEEPDAPKGSSPKASEQRRVRQEQADLVSLLGDASDVDISTIL